MSLEDSSLLSARDGGSYFEEIRVFKAGEMLGYCSME